MRYFDPMARNFRGATWGLNEVLQAKFFEILKIFFDFS